MEMSAKKWISLVVSMVMLFLLTSAFITWRFDPLWGFRPIEGYKLGFNERQQKTDYLNFVDNQYNAIVLGSSRTTYLDANLIEGYKTFNYSSNSMNPTEYAGFLETFTHLCGTPGLIVIGLDFWGTNANDTASFEKPSAYLERSEGFAYRYKNLASLDALKYGIRNWYYNEYGLPTDEALYDNLLRKREFGNNSQLKEQRTRNQVKYYQELAYGNYVWRANYDSLLLKLKQTYPTSKFIVYTTPVTDTLLSLLAAHNLLDNYEQWLRSAVNTFGEVHHFMFYNPISNNDSLFFDTQHFKPQVGASILQEMGLASGNTTINWGRHITLENLDKQIFSLRENLVHR